MRTFLMCVAVCSVVFTARLSSADEADDLFQAGREAAKAERFDEAEGKYEAAFALRKSPDIASNLAQVEMALGKKREAAEHLAYAVRLMPATTKPEVRAAMETGLADLRKNLGEIRIETNVPGATITADGRVLGTTPLADPLFIDPGTTVVFQATLNAHKTAESRVLGEAGAKKTVTMVLTPDQGSNVGPVTPTSKPLWPTLLLGGLGAAGVGVGIAGVVIGTNKHGDAEELATSCPASDASCIPTGRDLLDDGNAWLRGGGAAFGIGGAALIGMVLYLAIPQSDDAEETAAIAPSILPIIAPDATGAVVTFQF